MNSRQSALAQALVRAQDYALTRKSDFTLDPPTKVGAKFASALTRLGSAISDLGGKQAIQSGGGFGESTATQRELRAELVEELRDVVRTADAISEEQDNPALMDRFRMPSGSGDIELKSVALGMAQAIRDLSLNDEFEAHAHGADTAAELEEMVAEFASSEGAQGTALGTQAGATATIPSILARGRAGVKTLNALFHRVYADRPDVLTAWRTTSRPERAARTKPKVSTPATPNP
jgi:hypothetical protein